MLKLNIRLALSNNNVDELSRESYLFLDNSYTRTLVLINYWTESYENWCVYSLTRPPSLSQKYCLVVVLDKIKVVRNNLFSDKWLCCRTLVSSPTWNALKTYHQHYLFGLFISYQQNHSLFNLQEAGRGGVWHLNTYILGHELYISAGTHTQLTKSFENYCVHTLHIAY